MKKLLIFGLAIVVAILVLVSLSTARSKARDERAQTLETKTFENVDTSLLDREQFVSDKWKFQINFPDKWTPTPILDDRAFALELSADSSNDVIINMAAGPTDMGLEDLVLNVKDSLKRQGYNITYLEEKRAIINDLEVRVLVGKASDDGQVLYQESLLASKDRMLYMIVGTASESRWPEARKSFEASFSTFQVLP